MSSADPVSGAISALENRGYEKIGNVRMRHFEAANDRPREVAEIEFTPGATDENILVTTWTGEVTGRTFNGKIEVLFTC